MITGVAFLIGVLIGGLVVLGRAVYVEAQRDQFRLDSLRTILRNDSEEK